jgi:hypothetical protein
MPQARSAEDATRFTSTGPYVKSKLSFKQPIAPTSKYGPAPPNETPQQKVARLREAARLQREDIPRLEKFVNWGRRLADHSHRTFVLTFLTLSAIGTAYTTIASLDMMYWNRRKRSEWLREKDMAKARVLLQAQRAAREGLATDDQILLLAQQRDAAIREEEKAKKVAGQKGIRRWTSDFLFHGMNQEDKAAKLASRARINAMVQEMTEQQAAIQQRSNVKPEEMFRGGTLDRMGQDIAGAASWITKRLTGWAGGQS